MNVNKFIGIGRLGQNPELKQISSDFKVVNFSMAFSETWTDKQTGEKKESTDWHNFVASNRTAEVIEKYVKKGDQLYVEGKLKTRSWDKDGVKQYATFVQVELVQLFPKMKENQTDEKIPSYESPVRSNNLPPSEMAFTDGEKEPEEPNLPF